MTIVGRNFLTEELQFIKVGCNVPFDIYDLNRLDPAAQNIYILPMSYTNIYTVAIRGSYCV